MKDSDFERMGFMRVFSIQANPIAALKIALDALKTDSSARLLFISNLLFLIFALLEQVEYGTIIFIYVCQSIIIGYFHIIKYLLFDITGPSDSEILSVQGDNKGSLVRLFKPNSPVTYNARQKRGWAFFFIIHFGLVNLIFLNIETVYSNTSEFIFYSIILFFITHLFSFLTNLKKDLAKQWTLGEMMFLPYLRIIPNFLVVYCLFLLGFLFIPLSIFYAILANNPLLATQNHAWGKGTASAILITIFVIIKTLVDLVTHSFIHQNEKIAEKEISNFELIKIGAGATIIFAIILYFFLRL